MKRLAPVLLAVALLSACGGEADDPTVAASPGAGGSSSAEPGVSPTPCESAQPTQEPRPATSSDLSVKPEIEGTDAPPPCGLVVRDVVVGDGAEVAPGSMVQVKYVGALYDSGEQFDASWDVAPDYTLDFQAGAGQLIPGFDDGVVGMKEGGRREIVIPSELGYGQQGAGSIPPGATLVFVVDVVTVEPPPS